MTTSDSTASNAGSANRDMIAVPAIPALSPQPISTGASNVPTRPMLFAQPMPTAALEEMLFSAGRLNRALLGS